MGPAPSEFIDSKPVSYVCDDYSPIEYAAVYGSAGILSLRLTLEFLSPENGFPYSRDQFLVSMRGLGEKMAAFDMTWTDICLEALTTSEQPTGTTHYSQYIIGCDFTPKGIYGKSWFFPHFRAKHTSVEINDIVTECMSKIGVANQWLPVISYVKSLPKASQPKAEMIGVDCFEPVKSRIKPYFRVPVKSLVNIIEFMTLGGTLNDPDISDTVSALKKLWSLLFPGISDDQPLVPNNPNQPNGFMIYFEMGLGRTRFIPKVYIPVARYCPSDAHIAKGVSTYYRDIGEETSAELYLSNLKQFSHRDLLSGAGVHTHIGVVSKKGKGTEISVYFNPEVFASPRPVSVINQASQSIPEIGEKK
ncbi:aromatic prenyltransferase [Mycena floridula]|nr:aromatic prenyltransferase [Mycena floridula]